LKFAEPDAILGESGLVLMPQEKAVERAAHFCRSRSDDAANGSWQAKAESNRPASVECPRRARAELQSRSRDNFEGNLNSFRIERLHRYAEVFD